MKNDVFLKNYFNNKNFIITTGITKEFVEMTLNWFESLKRLNLHENVMIFCFDKYDYTQFKNNKIPFVLIDTEISMDSIEEDSTVKQKFEILKYLTHLLKIDILYSDVDIVFFKNPIDKLLSLKKDNDLILSINYPVNLFVKKYGYINQTKNDITIENLTFNFFYFPYKGIQTSNIWEKVLENLIKIRNNFIDFKSIDNFLNIKIFLLSNLEFCNFSCMFDESYVNYYIKNCFLIHYNYRNYIEYFIPNIITTKNFNDLETVKNDKIKLMKLNNHWFI
jgi:hypothetical protein